MEESAATALARLLGQFSCVLPSKIFPISVSAQLTAGGRVSLILRQLASLAAEGIQSVINLGVLDSPYDHPEERQVVDSAGLGSVHIPVLFNRKRTPNPMVPSLLKVGYCMIEGGGESSFKVAWTFLTSPLIQDDCDGSSTQPRSGEFAELIYFARRQPVL
jgi:hypothetical protein